MEFLFGDRILGIKIAGNGSEPPRVAGVMMDSEAERLGVRPGMRVLEVGGTCSKRMSVKELVGALANAERPVRLTLSSPAASAVDGWMTPLHCSL